MLKKLISKKNKTQDNFISLGNLKRYSTGIMISNQRLSIVQLIGNNITDCVLSSYTTTLLEKDIFSNGVILHMDKMVKQLNSASRKVINYSNKIVVSIPQQLVTMQRFFHGENEGISLADSADYQAAQIGHYDEINYDYFNYSNIPDESNEQNILLVASKRNRIESIEYAFELANLKPDYIDVESVSRANAYFYWMNNKNNSLEDKVVVLVDITEDITCFSFVKNGILLSGNDFSIGLNHLLDEILEVEKLSYSEIIDFYQGSFDISLFQQQELLIRQKIIKEIQSAIHIFYSVFLTQEQHVDHIFLTGIGTLYFDLASSLQSSTGINTTVTHPIESVPHKNTEIIQKDFSCDAVNLSVAFGLALRGFL